MLLPHWHYYCPIAWNYFNQSPLTAAVAQLVRAFTSHAEVGCSMSQLRKTLVVKTGNDNSIKRSEIMGSRSSTLQTETLCHCRCGTLKNAHCSMAMSAKYRSKFIGKRYVFIICNTVAPRS